MPAEPWICPVSLGVGVARVQDAHPIVAKHQRERRRRGRREYQDSYRVTQHLHSAPVRLVPGFLSREKAAVGLDAGRAVRRTPASPVRRVAS